MCCTIETHAPTVVGSRPSLGLFDYPGAGARPGATETKGRTPRARSREPDGHQLTAAGVVLDTTKSDPQHIWGDEGPVNE